MKKTVMPIFAHFSVSEGEEKQNQDIQFQGRSDSIWILHHPGWPQSLMANMFLKNAKPCFPGLTASEQDLPSHVQIPQVKYSYCFS